MAVAQSLKGEPSRVVLAGDVVERPLLDAAIAKWPRSGDKAAIAELERTLVGALSARGYFGVKISGTMVGDVLRLDLRLRRLGDLEIKSDLPLDEQRRILAQFKHYLCDGAPACAPVVSLRSLEKASQHFAEWPGVSLHCEPRLDAVRDDLIDVRVVANRTSPLRVSGSIDNLGSAVTGRTRYGASLDYGDLTGRSESESVQVSATASGLVSATASLGHPLGSGQLSAAVSHLTYTLGGAYAVLGYSGAVDSQSASYSWPLAQEDGLKANLRATIMEKQNASRIESAAVASRSHSGLASLLLSGSYVVGQPAGGRGSGLFQGQVSLDVGRLTLSDAASRLADAATARTAGAYARFGHAFQYQQPGPLGVNLNVRLRGQYADRNLDPAEKFVMTGIDVVRAFPAGVLTADAAEVVSLDAGLPLPTVPLPGPLGQLALSVSAFTDGGWGRVNMKPWLAYDGPTDIGVADVGAGLDWTLGPHLSGRATLAREVGRAYAPGRPNTTFLFELTARR